MQKKNLFLIGLVTLSITCTSCGSNVSSKANEAFENENYSEVIEILKNSKSDDGELKTIENISRGCVAAEKGNYSQAVELLSKEELTENQQAVLDKSFETLLSKSFDKNNVEDTLSAVEKMNASTNSKNTISEYFYELIDQKYTSEKYEDFIFVDNLIEKISDEEISKTIQKKKAESVNARTEAYLYGTWVRKDGTNFDEMKIEVKKTEKGLVGLVIKGIGDIASNETKWKDGYIIDENTFSIEDLSKSSDGYGDYSTSTCTIDYNEERIFLKSSSADTTEYSKGSNQVWYKEEALKRYKDIPKFEYSDFDVVDSNESVLIKAGNLIQYLKNNGSESAYLIYDKSVDKSEKVSA